MLRKPPPPSVCCEAKQSTAHDVGWHLRAKAFKLTGRVLTCSGQCCILHLCFLWCTRSSSQLLKSCMEGLKHMPSSFLWIQKSRKQAKAASVQVPRAETSRPSLLGAGTADSSAYLTVLEVPQLMADSLQASAIAIHCSLVT